MISKIRVLKRTEAGRNNLYREREKKQTRISSTVFGHSHRNFISILNVTFECALFCGLLCVDLRQHTHTHTFNSPHLFPYVMHMSYICLDFERLATFACGEMKFVFMIFL